MHVYFNEAFRFCFLKDVALNSREQSKIPKYSKTAKAIAAASNSK